MNKQVFLSLALLALVQFSVVRADDASATVPAPAANGEVKVEIQQAQPNSSTPDNIIDIKVTEQNGKVEGEVKVENNAQNTTSPQGEVKPEDKKQDGAPVVGKKEEGSSIAAAWNNFKAFYNNHKTAIRVGSAAVVTAYVAHKIMYLKCPWYRNWVNGVDEDEDAETSKLPWARI